MHRLDSSRLTFQRQNVSQDAGKSEVAGFSGYRLKALAMPSKEVV
jgi:hypothetical protein